MKKLIYLTFFIFLYSCAEEKQKQKITLLKKVKTFDQLSNGALLSDVRCMAFYKDFIYMSDSNSSELYQLNAENFSLNQVIGKAGNGPGELNGLSDFFIDNDYIYLTNDFNRSFEIYNNDKYIKTLKIFSEFTNIRFGFRFFTKNENIYITHSPSLSPIVEFNFKEKKFLKKGKPFVFELDNLNKIRNNTNLLKFKEKTISISDNMPIIKVYDEDLKLEKEISIDFIEEIKKTLKHINLNQFELDDSSYMELIKDAYIYGNKLYILINSYEPYRSDKVLMFELENENNLKFKSIFQLDKNSVYKSICSNNNQLIAFNYHTGSIDVFNLN